MFQLTHKWALLGFIVFLACFISDDSYVRLVNPLKESSVKLAYWCVLGMTPSFLGKATCHLYSPPDSIHPTFQEMKCRAIGDSTSIVIFAGIALARLIGYNMEEDNSTSNKFMDAVGSRIGVTFNDLIETIALSVVVKLVNGLAMVSSLTLQAVQFRLSEHMKTVELAKLRLSGSNGTLLQLEVPQPGPQPGHMYEEQAVTSSPLKNGPH